MRDKKVKLIVTLGPATRTEQDLRMLKDKQVDFVRTNMSHSTVEDLHYFIDLAKKVDIPFVIDTEGSQIRTGPLEQVVYFEEGDEVKLFDERILGNRYQIAITPQGTIAQLEPGDILRVDFDTLMLRVADTSPLTDGYIVATAITAGYLGSNKGVVIDAVLPKSYTLPCLTEKDYESIRIGLEEGVGYIAASFMRSGAFVEEVRRATHNSMKIISKIECVDGLEHLDEIIEATDYLLIDRGDLSKEIPLEKIPLTQKMILHRARKAGKGVFVATNLLETMVEKRKPTRAEVHDVVDTILDGAHGLALSAETAIGKYPMECVNMMNRLIRHVETTVEVEKFVEKEDKLVKKMEIDNYLLSIESSSTLIEPHGGVLVDRVLKKKPAQEYLRSLPQIVLSETQAMDVEQIAIGTFSPLTGFMGKKEVDSVLNTMRLPNGVVWPLPILLDVEREIADQLKNGQDVALIGPHGNCVAILHIQEKFSFDKKEFVQKLYGTDNLEHPGVRAVFAMQSVCLGGVIDLVERRGSETAQYELTPRQVRRLFDERGWTKIVGFHTRNVIHRSHEYIQLKAMQEAQCDGLFVHPVIGKKKVGDYHAKFIIKSYETMMRHFYPKGKVVFATYATFSRYAGPREALFTALCRKNFGCSHFIVGRDHTGVGNFYSPTASHDIFDQFSAEDIGIVPVRFGQIFYSEKTQSHVHEKEDQEHIETEKMHISGTQARKMFEAGGRPPDWFMRLEVSEIIVRALQDNEDVFVKE